MHFKKPDTHTLVLATIGVLVVLASGLLAAWLYQTTDMTAQRAEARTTAEVRGNIAPQQPHTTAPQQGLKPMPKAWDDAMAGIKPTPKKMAPTFEALTTPKYISNAEPGEVIFKKRPKIAIVIDDVGVHKALSRKADEMLPPAVTFSFLPYGGATMELAKKARKEGREVMIHLPMEPMPRMEEPPIDPGPNALYIDLPPEEIRKRTHINLAALKDMSVGVNNHMGSRFTAYEDGMKEVLKIVDAEGLFFMDSLTTNQSAVEDAANAVAPEMPLLKRDVFLDHYITEEALNKALIRLEEEAQEKGYAIAIGHPHSRTLNVLRDWLPTLPYKGIDLVPITHMLPSHAEAFKPMAPQLPEGTPMTNLTKTKEPNNVQTLENEQPQAPAQQKQSPFDAPHADTLNPERKDENTGLY